MGLLDDLINRETLLLILINLFYVILYFLIYKAWFIFKKCLYLYFLNVGEIKWFFEWDKEIRKESSWEFFCNFSFFTLVLSFFLQVDLDFLEHPLKL
mgnify:CR=1 FL=1